MKKFLVLVVSGLFLVSCGKQPDQAKPAAASGDYLVKINDLTVSKADLDKELKKMPEEVKQAMMKNAQTYTKFLEDYASKEALGLEAKSKKIEEDPDFISKMDYMKKMTAIQLLLEKEIAKEIKISDKDIQDYYNKNKGQFAAPPTFKVSHIQVKTQAEADKVKDRLKKGEDFAKIAKEVSEDKESAKNGGELGMIEPGKLPAELDQVMTKMKKGEVSAPIKSKYGFHILKVNDVKQSAGLDINAIKEDLRNVLMQEKQQEIFNKYIADIRKKYKIEINNAQVEKVIAAANQGKPKADKPASSHAGDQTKSK
ncbi:MAG: peptidylprolyl isomerase [Nitrospiraceae bacterium]|nr:peptidylprolyl isomerase [Nitrospiraceae bacterium]